MNIQTQEIFADDCSFKHAIFESFMDQMLPAQKNSLYKNYGFLITLIPLNKFSHESQQIEKRFKVQGSPTP